MALTLQHAHRLLELGTSPLVRPLPTHTKLPDGGLRRVIDGAPSTHTLISSPPQGLTENDLRRAYRHQALKWWVRRHAAFFCLLSVCSAPATPACLVMKRSASGRMHGTQPACLRASCHRHAAPQRHAKLLCPAAVADGRRHPDKNVGREAEAADAFQQLTAAFNLLSRHLADPSCAPCVSAAALSSDEQLVEFVFSDEFFRRALGRLSAFDIMYL